MAGVVIVTDSSTCLPVELTDTLPIRVLPISVYLPEGVAGPAAAQGPISEAAEHAELSAANHPFVTEYLGAIEAGSTDAAVIVTPAIEFAAMFRNAALAAELAERPCATIDARTAAGGQALVVLAGAQAAACGAPLEEVVRVIEDASRRVSVVASLATLDPIRRNGPLPRDLLGEGSSSGSRSVFRMRDGTVEPIATLDTLEQTLETIAATVAAESPAGVEACTVFHADAPDLARRLGSLIERVDFISGFSMAMQVHTGPGVVGAAWIARDAGSVAAERA